MSQCKQIINAHPETGSPNREPVVRNCQNKAGADGYCGFHRPANVEARRLRDEEVQARFARRRDEEARPGPVAEPSERGPTVEQLRKSAIDLLRQINELEIQYLATKNKRDGRK